MWLIYSPFTCTDMDNLTNSINNSLPVAFESVSANNTNAISSSARVVQTTHILRILFSVLSSLFHVGGLCLLFTVKRRKRTSTPITNMVSYSSVTLLIFLSFSEMVQGFFTAVIAVCEIINQKVINFIAMGVVMVSQGMGVCSIYLITLNRLVGALYPLWYRRTMTKKKFYAVVVCVSVIVGGLYVAGMLLYNLPSSSTKSAFIGGVIICLIYFFLLLSTLLDHLRQNFRRNTQVPTQRPTLLCWNQRCWNQCCWNQRCYWIEVCMDEYTTARVCGTFLHINYLSVIRRSTVDSASYLLLY